MERAQCSKANPCTDGLGNPIVAQIPKANPWYSIAIAGLAIVAAAVRVGGGVRRPPTGRGRWCRRAGLALLFLLGAVAWQIYQFQVLPFTTIDGAYASTFEFFMGSTLAHLILLRSSCSGCGCGRARVATNAHLVPDPDHPVLRGVDRRVGLHPDGGQLTVRLNPVSSQ